MCFCMSAFMSSAPYLNTWCALLLRLHVCLAVSPVINCIGCTDEKQLNAVWDVGTCTEPEHAQGARLRLWFCIIVISALGGHIACSSATVPEQKVHIHC